MASLAVAEGKKASTATSLFSFFLSELILVKEGTIYVINKRVCMINHQKDTIFKEASDFHETMGRELADISQVAILGIISTHSNDLIIFLSLINQTISIFLNLK